MAMKLTSTIHTYVGESTDSKPSGAPVGSRLYEIDTKATKVYTGSYWGRETITTMPHLTAGMMSGNRYKVTHWVEIGTGTAATVLITTPASATVSQPQFTYSVHSVGQIKIVFSEDPNASAGTVVTPYNLNRQKTSAASVIVHHSTSYVSSGTILSNFEASGRAVGGDVSFMDEFILDNSSEYLIYVTAYSANTEIAINAWWSEGKG